MKNISFYLICYVIFIISSCQEKEDPIPSNLIGIWEIANIDSTIELETVTRYTFRGDGTYSFEWLYREPGSRDDIGFQSIWNGRFRVSEDQVTFNVQEIFMSPLNSPPFGSREEMTRSNTSGQQTHQFTVSHNGDQLTIFADDPMASDQVFSKVLRNR